MTDSLKNKPELPVELTFIWEAFVMLTTDRTYRKAFGKESEYVIAGAIPTSEITNYCQVFGICDTEQAHRILRLVKALDREYLDAVNPKVK